MERLIYLKNSLEKGNCNVFYSNNDVDDDFVKNTLCIKKYCQSNGYFVINPTLIQRILCFIDKFLFLKLLSVFAFLYFTYLVYSVSTLLTIVLICLFICCCWEVMENKFNISIFLVFFSRRIHKEKISKLINTIDVLINDCEQSNFNYENTYFTFNVNKKIATLCMILFFSLYGIFSIFS